MSIERQALTGAVSKNQNRTFRPEIEGLRFFAVLLIVVYHIWLGRVSGGVDIFLLVSSFLMTMQFTRRIERAERFNLGKHWLHLLKRLLPIAVLVIVATTLMSWLLIPENRWPATIAEGWSSLFYFENWTLAANAVDYYANHSAASPFQHFWSLSIQGQVFIIWPLIFLGISWLRRRFAWNHKLIMLIVFGAIFVVSLAFSIWETSTDQAFAYFDLRTRLWEFALGSLLALALPYLNFPRLLRIFMGWGGVVLIISCGLVLQVDRQFPGYLALWPTLAAGMVILAGNTSSPWGADRLLSSKPLVYMGGNSYGLYLWHWPILVLFLVWQERESVGWLAGSAIILAALVLAVVSTQLIERPLRKIPWVELKWYRSALVVLLCLLVAATPLISWQISVQTQINNALNSPPQDNPGAAALVPGFVETGNPKAPLVPAPADLPNQFATLGSKCTGKWATSDPVIGKICVATAPAASAPSKTILVLGDSHSEQLLPALEYTAKAENWQLVSILKGGCTFSVPDKTRQDSCSVFNRQVMKYALERKPDAVFTIGTASAASSPKEVVLPGFLDATNALEKAGIQMIAVRDNPRFNFNMAECVLNKGAKNAECNPRRASVMADVNPLEQITPMPANLHTIDLTDFICTPMVCPGVVGNMFVYLDDNHLTKDYSVTLGPLLQQKILAAMNWGK
ncbi:acyltransferase family protein [Psychromicrobium sp. YIM B11713]|uniref:acyltransferase family protein n=1 Tax=Psychromicrobium sp. YIM B11713 TaxID=3145233 RepID=UPI00374EEE70